MLQQVLQPMEYTYGDYMNEEQLNEVTFVVISEEVARTTYGSGIILKPIIKVETETFPYLLKYSISFGYIFKNEELKNVEIDILNKEGEVIDTSDITALEFSNPVLFNSDGVRRESLLIGESGLSSTSGIFLKGFGKYKVHIKFNGKILGETYFIVIPSEVLSYGVKYE
ncbi:hypothetical protein [Paenibacillus sp. FSL K6-1318]|uniref:hypothetical protein n=1 Tax=Paenibacillus sp. FSL K6-1318 TaxID=2975291 RepID=UPI0030EC798A